MPRKPVVDAISSEYGVPRKTKEDPNRIHNGVDYLSPKGSLVKASESGVVVSSFYHEPKETIETGKDGKKKKKFKGGYGNLIVIDHAQSLIKEKNFLYTLYAHLDSRRVSLGETVLEGEVIGTSGRTGTKQDFYNWKGGYHLHFEVLESDGKLWWKNSDNTGVPAGHYRINPRKFFRRSFGLKPIVKPYKLHRAFPRSIGQVFDPFVTPHKVIKPFSTDKIKKH